MSKIMLSVLAAVFIFGSVQLSIASDMATKEDCVQKVGEVVAIAKDKSAQEAIDMVNDKDGPFIWKDSYVYIMDLSANIVAHGPQPKFIGKNLMGLKDPMTKQPWYPAVFDEIKASENSKGWFTYNWKKPNAEGVFEKNCYYERAGDVVVFAGVYGKKVK